MSWPRIAALMRKDAAELRLAKSLWLGPLAMLVPALALPLVIVFWLPAWTGSTPADIEELAAIAQDIGWRPGAGLASDALAQAFVLHRFLPLLALVPIVSALTIVTTSIVTEKQARTLEPLLATPLTAGELLVAKIATAFAGAMALMTVGFALLVAASALLGAPGVAATFFASEPLLLVWLVAPAASLLALVVGAIVSTRAKDARAAQQFGVVVIVPFIAVFMSGLTGGGMFPPAVLAGVAAGLAGLALALGRVASARFSRERMLTEWR